jgi:hypothetical protein
MKRPFSTYPNDAGELIRSKDSQSSLISAPLLSAVDEPLLTTNIPSIPPLPSHVWLLHHFVFAADANHPKLQLLITYGTAVACLGHTMVTSSLASYETHWGVFAHASDFSFAAELVVNLMFCYWHPPHKQIVSLLIWTDHIDTASLIKVLGRAAWAGWMTFLTFAGLLIWLTRYGRNEWNAADVACSFGIASAWVLTLYLCIIWLWVNWLIHTTVQHWIEHQMDANSAGVDKELWRLLAKMKEVSNTWALNHTARLVTTAAYATTNLCSFMSAHQASVADFRGQDQRLARETWDITTALISYSMVWVTAAAPGYVTDSLFSSLQRRLYKMGEDPKLTAKCVSLMHRFHYLEGREGIHFAHVPMTLARSITIGTALSYTIGLVVRGQLG